MTDKPRLPPTGNYEVGYGKPPKNKRFRKGASGNPKGRPKGSRNKAHLSYERLSKILVSEAYREVEIQDRTGPVSMPMVRAAMRSLTVKAAKGEIGAQRLFFSSLSAIEEEEKRERLENYDKARAYQKRMRSVIRSYRDQGKEPPEMLPHPDDIELDMETGEVIVHGPVSPEDKAEWKRIHDYKSHCEEEIEGFKTRIKLLEARDSGMLAEEGLDDDSAVVDHIAYLQKQLEFERYILITTCLSIMRRWSLPGKNVTRNYVLSRLLDQHVANGTDPKPPGWYQHKPIDWEEMYRRRG